MYLYTTPFAKFKKMGRLRGIEPPNVGTTIRCVNHFATAAKILTLNKKMPWDRVELPTHGASIHCSTNWAIKAKMAVPTGIEPAISCVTGRRDNRYTTGPNYKNCGRWIWTIDLWVMSPTSCQTAPSRDNKNGGGKGIRTPASFYTPVGFQDRSLQPDLGIPPW